MTKDAGGNIYFAGTGDEGKLYRYAPEERRLECVGINPANEWVWDLAAAADGSIYGATYPDASVFEYKPGVGFRNYGTIAETQNYARSIAATEEHLYSAAGSTISLHRIHRKTGEMEELHLEGFSGTLGFIHGIWPSGGLLFLAVMTKGLLV